MIRRLLQLNGVAILCVILFHASGWGFVAMLFWADRYGAVPADQIGTFSYYVLRAIEQLIVFAIPAFLFVSGFFIAFATGRAHKTIGWKVVGIRIRDLIIPYTLWTIIIWVLFFLEGKRFSPGEYLTLYVTGATDPAYYYVPLLIQFYILSPLIVRWAKVHPISLLIITGMIQLAVQLQYYPSLFGVSSPYLDIIPKWLFVTRIFWFSLGVVAGFNVKLLQTYLERYKRGMLATAVILFVLGIIEWELVQSVSGEMWLQHRETLLDSIYSVAVIFAFLGYYRMKIRYDTVLDDLGSRSFGIYLIHTIAMTYLARAIAVKLPALLAYQLIFMIIMIGFGLAVPLLLMAVINRSPLRAYYKYIFG